MIEKIYNWFFSKPISIQISIGWLVSCSLTLGIILVIYKPFVLLVMLMIGASIFAIVRILLYYLFQDI